MSNIIGLNGRAFASVLPEPPTPVEVVAGLKALLTARIISQDAFCLGVMICAQSQASGSRDITCSHDAASKIVVRAHGQVFSGPVGRDRFAFTEAMQGLHFCAGILSHYDEQKLEEFDAAERHFSMSPEVGSDKMWNIETPILFRMPTVTKQDFSAKVSAAFQDRMSRMAGSLDLDLTPNAAQRH